MENSILVVQQQVSSWIIKVPTVVTALEGSCVEVPCHTQRHRRVIWYQYDSLYYPKVYDGLSPHTVEGQFRGRTSVLGNAAEGNCTLRINRVRGADNNLQVYVWINPDEKPSQKFHQQIVTIRVVGRKAPIVSIQEEMVDGEIFQVNCSISHSCPSSPPSLHWNINKPVTVTLRVEKEPVIEGHSVTVECVANCNPPPYMYSWLRGQMGQSNQTNSTQGKMSFSNIVRDISLSCIAHNSMGAGRSDWLYLDVQYAPVMLSASACQLTGVALRCVCQAEASPHASIYWTIDGNDTQPSSFTSVSTNKENIVSVEINGPARGHVNVSCTAINSLGRDTKQLSVHSRSNTYVPSTVLPWMLAVMAFGSVLLSGCVVFIYRRYLSYRSQLRPNIDIAFRLQNLSGSFQQEHRYESPQR
ncbi:sialic acid-binding Ig-like lectin 5 [Centroberyx gerrardi]